MMKQSNSSRTMSPIDLGPPAEKSRWTEDEIDVMEFMEELRLTKLQHDVPDPVLPPRCFPITWGRKKKRSAIDRSPSPPQTRARFPSLSPPPPPPKKLKVDSPATPLSFSPSESEEKPSKPLKITLSKTSKKIEDLQNLCTELLSQRQAFEREIEKVQRYRDKLKIEQSELKEKLYIEKAKKQNCVEPPAVGRRLNLTIGQPTISCQEQPHEHVSYIVRRHQTVVVDQTAGESPCSRGELLDLNVAPAEAAAAQMWDLGFASMRSTEMAAAQAKQNRLNRKQKIQWKNNPTMASKFRAVR